jgi:hypothetical protein
MALEPVERGIEGPLRDLEHIAGDLLNALGDAPAMPRFELDGPEDQEIERALDEIGSTRLFVTQRHDRIDLRRTPRGHV